LKKKVYGSCIGIRKRIRQSSILQSLVAEIGCVEYALKNANQPIGVATFSIETTLPDELKKLLPSPELLEKHFHLIERIKK
jgi:hypothetical protein